MKRFIYKTLNLTLKKYNKYSYRFILDFLLEILFSIQNVKGGKQTDLENFWENGKTIYIDHDLKWIKKQKTIDDENFGWSLFFFLKKGTRQKCYQKR